jgi:hypothetical protein
MNEKSFMHDEIVNVLNYYKDNKMDWNAGKIANEIVRNHIDEIGGEWVRFNVYSNVRSVVGKYISKIADKEIEDKNIQLTFEGFEYVQKYYMVVRDGERVGVFIENCTKEELLEKIQTYRKQAGSLLKHSNELERYVQLRETVLING